MRPLGESRLVNRRYVDYRCSIYCSGALRSAKLSGDKACGGDESVLGWNEVEQAFNDAVERGVIPGATVVVRVGADVAFEGAFGFRSIFPARTPIEIDTVFDLSSLT